MADGQTQMLSQEAAEARAAHNEAMWYSNLMQQGLAAAEKMAAYKPPEGPDYERMAEREELEARWRYLRGQLANLDPGDFVGRWILSNAIERLKGQLYRSRSVSTTGVGGYHTYTDSAGQTHRVYYSGETEPRKEERYVPRTVGLSYPEWVKNLGLVAQTGALGNMPRALAPLGAQASLTPSQMTGLMGLITLAGEQPTTQKLPTSKKHLGLPNWAEYQKRVTNYLPSWLESYQALSQKLFPKTYGVRPRWATAYQR